jgi:hypothetical protein
MSGFRSDPELIRIRELLLELAGGDSQLLDTIINEVFFERGEVVLSEVVDLVSNRVAEPQRRRIQQAKQSLFCA